MLETSSFCIKFTCTYSQHLVDRIHVFGKLLGKMDNVSDLDPGNQLIRNVTVVIHENALVSGQSTQLYVTLQLPYCIKQKQTLTYIIIAMMGEYTRNYNNKWGAKFIIMLVISSFLRKKIS